MQHLQKLANIGLLALFPADASFEDCFEIYRKELEMLEKDGFVVCPYFHIFAGDFQLSFAHSGTTPSETAWCSRLCNSARSSPTCPSRIYTRGTSGPGPT